MTSIRLGLHLHPPRRQGLDAFAAAVKRADAVDSLALAPATLICRSDITIDMLGCRADRGEVVRTNGRSLLIAALIIGFLCAHAARALAAQAKPLIKVMAGYGSTDGGVSVLGFAKETKLFEKHGLDVVLVGMGTGSVSLRALIANDLQIASLSLKFGEQLIDILKANVP